MSDYIIYYAESNIVCLIIFGILLTRDLLNVDRQEKQIKYDHTLVAFMLYFISDMLWASVIAGLLPRTRFSIISTNFANCVLMSLITYEWLNYVMAVELVPHRNRPINKFAVIFPLLVSTIVMVITFITAPHMLLNDSLELQPAYTYFQILVPSIYIIAILFYSIKKAKGEENSSEKKRFLYIGFFPLMVVIGGLFQILFLPRTPIFCFCCTILMLIFYIQSMETQISMDPLTRLNNRGQLLRYIAQKTNIHKDGRPTFIIMLDINDFKQINDTYGHAEGDRALVITADSLKKASKAFNISSFLGRYGGDEFILIVHPDSKNELDSLITEIRKQITAGCQAHETPYVLSVGAGYDELLSGQDTFQRCMQRADEKLYQDKEYCKLHGLTTVCR